MCVSGEYSGTSAFECEIVFILDVELPGGHLAFSTWSAVGGLTLV